jgi:hypothetical protein
LKGKVAVIQEEVDLDEYGTEFFGAAVVELLDLFLLFFPSSSPRFVSISVGLSESMLICSCPARSDAVENREGCCVRHASAK